MIITQEKKSKILPKMNPHYPMFFATLKSHSKSTQPLNFVIPKNSLLLVYQDWPQNLSKSAFLYAKRVPWPCT
jgi:hypothetical protein